ncbi:PDDEXK nuclease domain-containing protein [uncultured Chitinophaga sp.]|uniref:PDDEXK nuclease domain-containing protein n=1 Tax=uncultured Chitinophaga sp. TaxID=339340 RepID=UPI0025D6FC7C|nr:PDDEXK nuclease domain-containing protein [uncultured Chitinophaga sp.]
MKKRAISNEKSIALIAADIHQLLSEARKQVCQSINTSMVTAYWRIGRRIVEEEQQGKARAGYGQYLLEQLSTCLASEGNGTFSVANLKNFRQFYLVFPDLDIGNAVRYQLSWTHYRLIMRISNPEARMYYLSEASSQFWSTRLLERNINSLYYERLLSTRTGAAAVKGEVDTSRFIKDPYVLEFLGADLPPEASESELETAIIGKLQLFLLEMGKGFAFVSRQYRISTETRHFYIDLVFYNYILKCFILIDLKITALSHQDIGQMDMYVRMFEDLVKGTGDSPTLGMILCADKDNTMVKYSILEESKQLFASKYSLVLPTEDELRARLQREGLFN